MNADVTSDAQMVSKFFKSNPAMRETLESCLCAGEVAPELMYPEAIELVSMTFILGSAESHAVLRELYGQQFSYISQFDKNYQ